MEALEKMGVRGDDVLDKDTESRFLSAKSESCENERNDERNDRMERIEWLSESDESDLSDMLLNDMVFVVDWTSEPSEGWRLCPGLCGEADREVAGDLDLALGFCDT